MITIAGQTIADGIASSTSATVGQLVPIVVIVGGTLLAVLVIGQLISFFRHRG
jgi:hypothetical protein